MNGEDRKFSRRAVLLAVESEYGNRLVEITREDISLVKELAVNRSRLTDTNREIIKARIAQLRQERDGIVQQFEGGPTDEVDNN